MTFLAVALGAALLLAAPVAIGDDFLTGEVVGVTDGDNITVLVDRHPIKVRLAEIDAPETRQPWGNRAKQALSAKVFGQMVQLEVVGIDHYGRTLAKVYR